MTDERDERSDEGERTEPEDDGAERGADEPRRPRLDARGMARPSFLLDYPEDPALEPLIQAFEAGDYAFVRAHAAAVAERAEREDVREAARELRERIEPDPLARYLVAISVLLLVFLVLWTYLGHDH